MIHNWFYILLHLTSFVIIVQDYRGDVIKELRSRGKTPEEIDRFIPRTAEEQLKYVADERNNNVKMKEDIAFLLNEVHELRELIGAGRKKNATDES